MIMAAMLHGCLHRTRSRKCGDGAVSFLPPDVLSSQRKTNKCDKVLTENCVNMSEINKLLFNEE